MANVTPITPQTLPYTYTANFGQAYQLASAAQQGCVDTVYPLTANAGGVFNVKGVPLSAGSALSIIGQANSQFGPLFVACTSLTAQASNAAAASTANPLDLYPAIGTGSWVLDDAVLIVAFIPSWSA